jgi:hypothetical protein
MVMSHCEHITHTFPVIKNCTKAGCQWLTPVITATQEAEIRRIKVRSQPEQIVHETLSRKTFHTHTKKKKGLAEWLKVKALSPNPSTVKKKKEKSCTKYIIKSSRDSGHHKR